MMLDIVLVINICATLFMTGLIWFVQVVHYPGFLLVGRSEFSAYHRFHVPHTGYVVAPPMLLELASSVVLTIYGQPFWWIHAAGLALVLLIWTSTGTLQVRYHNMLGNGDGMETGTPDEIKKRLITTNWIRTTAWSLKSLLGGYLLIEFL
ncbi:MAG: hypothetical protein R3281_04405 [Balneolaceae bacterium]|nr:hypothetical protein [Balneolaceae bacterium]